MHHINNSTVEVRVFTVDDDPDGERVDCINADMDMALWQCLHESKVFWECYETLKTKQSESNDGGILDGTNRTTSGAIGQP